MIPSLIGIPTSSSATSNSTIDFADHDREFIAELKPSAAEYLHEFLRDFILKRTPSPSALQVRLHRAKYFATFGLPYVVNLQPITMSSLVRTRTLPA